MRNIKAAIANHLKNSLFFFRHSALVHFKLLNWNKYADSVLLCWWRDVLCQKADMLFEFPQEAAFP